MKTQLLTKTPLVYLLVVVSILLSCNSCSSESVDNDPGEQVSGDVLADVNDMLAKLSNFTQPEASGEVLQKEEEPEREGNNNECVVKTYKAAPGFSEMILLDPTSDVIYPGAMLKGESIPTGEYIGITGGRAPITLSVSLESLNGKPSTVIENPNLNTVREGVKDMLQQGVTGSASAELVFTTEEVHSEEHLSVALGASYTKGKNSVSGSFNFSNSEKKYKYVIKYLQVYYTINLTIEDSENPGKLFSAVPNLNSTSPVIVSSVKYGRMLLYTVETNSEFTDTQGAFNAAFNGGSTGINGEYQSFWNSSTVKALIVGGSSGDAAQVVSGPEGVYNYIKEGGEYSADSPGAPLGYTLRYIKEGFPVANVVLSSQYNIRTCYEAYQRFHIELHGIKPKKHEGENNLEIYGTTRMRVVQDGKVESELKKSYNADPALNVDEDDFVGIGQSAEVELYMPNVNDDYVELYANFYESNGSFDPEHFGSKSVKMYLGNLHQITDANGDGLLNKADLPDNPLIKGKKYERVDLTSLPGSEFRAYYYVWRIY
ncbi:thiol-activated cytolysin family protein [uncultured Algibacter sp.]|uniref:thiol-activated cytolysin family protein n=1 Tax=uncultured Algibacter sp. TaxID=298659 RepID=UPI0026180CEE|nr:thiol-activated cytolysin family protein [uncultured Algibacter sp.]